MNKLAPRSGTNSDTAGDTRLATLDLFAGSYFLKVRFVLNLVLSKSTVRTFPKVLMFDIFIYEYCFTI